MRLPSHIWAPAVVALAAALSACTGERPADLIGSARTYLAKNDAKAAIIQLKGALQKEPDSGEARFLLGRALLDTGDAPGAIVEFTKALSLKQPETLVVPELARALKSTGEFQRLIEQFGQTRLEDPAAQSELQTSLAVAYGAMGRRDLANTAIDAALQSTPDFGPAKLMQARLMADAGEIDNALAEIDRLLQRTPQDAQAWLTKAELLNYGKRDLAGALAAYRQAAGIKPDLTAAQAGAMAILLGQRNLEGAKTQLEVMRKALPDSAQTRYFQGHVALLSKDVDGALEIANQLLSAAPDNPRVLQLAGAVAFERQDYLQADLHLSRALQIAPEQDATRRLLALSQLRSSQPAKALAVLQPLLDRPAPDAQTYSMVAQAHLQAGDVAAAEANFAKAAKLNPDDTRSRAALAVSRLVQGDSAGLSQLQSLAAADAGTSADLPLIAALVRKKDYAGALKAIDALEKKFKSPQPQTWNLRARVHLSQGDRTAARQAFEKALALQPAFLPAAAALASLDLADKQVDAAKKRFDAVLAADPGNVQAMLASAALKARTGAPREEVVAAFTDAIQRNPNATQARSALANFYLSQNESKLALEVAQRGAAALPNSPEMLEALGRAQLAAGESNQAQATLSKLVSLRPTSAQPLLLLAELHLMGRRPEEAAQQLRRALALAPDNLQAQRVLAELLVATGKHDEAMKIAREVQKQRPSQDAGFLIEAAVHASERKWDPAQAALRNGLKVTPDSTLLATRLHGVMAAAGQRDAAQQFAARWQKDHAEDAGFLFYLGDTALMARDRSTAEARYRDVLRLQPENALAMNNVAWLMATSGQRGALDLARKANQLLPNRPTILDTLAAAQLAEGQPAQAVDTLRKAVSIGGQDPALRLSLAKALAAAGDKGAARTELEALAKLGEAFAGQPEVAALLKGL